MAISKEALSSPPVVLTPNTAAMQQGKVARLEHFVGRRSLRIPQSRRSPPV